MKQMSMKKFKEMQLKDLLVAKMRIEIDLDIKPLSINDAHQGRHFPTDEKKAFEKEMYYHLARYRDIGRFASEKILLEIHYVFYLKNFLATDYDNLIKVTQDCLVKNGVIRDDRYIVKAIIEKKKADKDRIFIGIRKAEDLD